VPALRPTALESALALRPTAALESAALESAALESAALESAALESAALESAALGPAARVRELPVLVRAHRPQLQLRVWRPQRWVRRLQRRVPNHRGQLPPVYEG
jgi:hypothetical protein